MKAWISWTMMVMGLIIASDVFNHFAGAGHWLYRLIIIGSLFMAIIGAFFIGKNET